MVAGRTPESSTRKLGNKHLVGTSFFFVAWIHSPKFYLKSSSGKNLASAKITIKNISAVFIRDRHYFYSFLNC